MAIRTHALYLDLLKDLSGDLPVGVADEESVAKAGWFPGMSTRQFRALALAKSFFKKFEDNADRRVTDQAALDSFLQSNENCRKWTLRIESLEDEMLVGLFRQEIYRFFRTSKVDSICDSFDDILDFARTGPGASILARGTDFYTKLFASPLSFTRKILYSAYEHYFKHYPEWAEAERLRSAHFSEDVVVRGNRLSFVPKNAATSRTICTEPNLNMFFQLGLGRRVEKRLYSYFGIDMSSQPDINRDLARIGSLNNNLCTIDLSSASDSVSLGMLREFIPRDVLAWFEIIRSPEVQLPDGTWRELHMVSSMGNGFTFPLQTALFSCAVSAAYQLDSLKLVRPQVRHGRQTVTDLGNFGVFGDDIIVVKRAYRKVLRLLDILGFKVNAEKSFFEGPFRESCGGDFYEGQHARGIYIKSLRTPASRYVAINRLNEWSAMSGIPLRRTIHHLMKTVRILPVPLYENDDAGIKMPLQEAFRRANRQLSLVNYGSVVYRRWESIPQTIRIVDGALKVPRGFKGRYYNPSGLWLAFLRGDIRSDTLGSRLGPARYRTKEAVAPSWDWLPSVGKQFPTSQGLLAKAILINIC